MLFLVLFSVGSDAMTINEAMNLLCDVHLDGDMVLVEAFKNIQGGDIQAPSGNTYTLEQYRTAWLVLRTNKDGVVI